MKILRLDLTAFGPFTREKLDLAAGEQGLHLVYGPNEAGKSSALRALRQLLFGIDERTSDNFIHANADLLLGGLLQHSDGERLEFVRRKRRKDPVLDPEGDRPIPDSRFARFLAGLDVAMFETMFGLDHDRLKSGGRDLATGTGALAEIVFAAGSGVANLRSIQSGFDGELADLFKAKGRNQPINKTLRELRDHRDAVRKAQLSSEDWVKQNRRLAKSTKAIAELDDELRKLEREKSRLQRIQNALPAASRLRGCRKTLRELAAAPQLADDFTEQRETAQRDRALAENEAKRAREQIGKLEVKLADVHPDHDVLSADESISDLHQRLGSHRKAMQDRGKLVGQRQQRESDALNLLHDLRPGATLDEAEALRVSRTIRRRIRDMATQHASLTGRIESARKQLRQLRGTIERKTAQKHDAPEPADPQLLFDAVERVSRQGPLEEQLDSERDALRGLQTDVDAGLAKLPLWTGDADGLERLAVPSPETTDRFETELGDAERRFAESERQLAEAQASLRETEQRLQQLRGDRDVPTEGELSDARRLREQGWRLVRRAWLDESPTEEELSDFQQQFDAGDLPRAYEESVRRADDVADRLRGEADRVAERVRLETAVQDLTARVASCRDAVSAAERDRTERQNAWRAVWQPLNVEPNSPREMRAWRAEQQKLCEQLRDLRLQADKVTSLDNRIAGHRTELLAATAGSTPLEDDATLSQLLADAGRLANDLREQHRRRESLDAELQELREELSTAEGDLSAAESDLAAWTEQWTAEMTALGLPADASPGEAEELMDGVSELFKVIDEMRKLDERLAGIDDDAERFRDDVDALCRNVSPETAGQPVEQVVAQLHDRLGAARADRQRREEWTEHLAAEREADESARKEFEEQQTILKTLCEQAGCATDDELPQVEEQARRRRETEHQIQDLERDLSRHSGGAALDEFLAEIDEEETDEIPSQLRTIDEEIAECRGERDEQLLSKRDAEHELSRMTGSADAAGLEQETQELIAALENDVERYVRLKLAATVLRTGIQRYQEQNQTPVLKRAGELFATLTCGSFAGLRDDYDEEGNAALVGLRAGDGTIIGLDQMSDGTRDQLFLALRLAGVEHHLTNAEPMPLVLDDVLVNFDDERAAAALQALAETARRTQVIFFTHHHRLVEIAESRIDGQSVFVHELAG